MNDPILHNLDRPPRLNKIFLWADYAELRCLTNQDHIFSLGNMIDSLEEEADTGTDIEQPEDVQDSALNDADSKLAERWSDILRRLHSRSSCLGPMWPFSIEDGVLQCTYDAKNNSHKLYIALLIASALRYCPNNRRPVVTASIEEVAYFIFKELMPNGWEIHPFGAHQTLSERYKGHLYDKLSLLATDIRATLKVARSDFDEKDTGDGGLDVVAWHPMADSRESIPIAFGQCGCTPDEWPLKSLEAHVAKVGAIISPLHPWSNYYFMPHDMYKTGNTWEGRSDFAEAIYLDRVRIIKLAAQYKITVPSWEFVDEAANLNLPVAA